MTTSNIALFLYSEYLNIHIIPVHLFWWFSLTKARDSPYGNSFQDSLYCTTITMIWNIKMLVPTAQLPQIFVITPFQKKMMNIFPRIKTKQDRTKASPIQLAFSNGQFNKFQNISMHISSTWTHKLIKNPFFPAFCLAAEGGHYRSYHLWISMTFEKCIGISISRKLREANNFSVSSERGLTE